MLGRIVHVPKSIHIKSKVLYACGLLMDIVLQRGSTVRLSKSVATRDDISTAQLNATRGFLKTTASTRGIKYIQITSNTTCSNTIPNANVLLSGAFLTAAWRVSSWRTVRAGSRFFRQFCKKQNPHCFCWHYWRKSAARALDRESGNNVSLASFEAKDAANATKMHQPLRLSCTCRTHCLRRGTARNAL